MDDKKPLVSVIIPVYNAEKYLRECINSVLSQTYENLEIVLIDDGSTDESSKICDDFQEIDERIMVIHKENEGVSVARNTGIEKSTGEYITFLDSDDYITSTFVEDLYDAIVANNADVSWSGFLYVYEDNKSREKCFGVDKVVETKRIAKDFLSGRLAFGYCWGKLFDSKIVKNIRFQCFKVAEDELFVYTALKKCSKIAFVDKQLYCYRQNSESVMHKGKKKLYDMVKVAEIIRDDVEDELKPYAECLIATNAIYTYCRLCETECSDEVTRCKELIKKYRGKIMKYKFAPNKLKISCALSCVSFKVMAKTFFVYNVLYIISAF